MEDRNKMTAETKMKTKEKAITGKMTFGEILKNNPEAVEILFNSGLHCIGCGMAMYESLEDGCKAHGMNKKEIDELIKKLNNKKPIK
jgi:hybrid cluster-associated redox disulfide protein